MKYIRWRISDDIRRDGGTLRKRQRAKDSKIMMDGHVPVCYE
jgi:hypothetical protein